MQPDIGVVFRPTAPPEDLGSVVAAAEDAGVAELWVWEDCLREGGIATAAAALGMSRGLRVGVGLLPVTLRNAALTAMEIATLARLFPSRFLPGLGHGAPEELGRLGARASSPMTALREHLTAVAGLLRGEQIHVDGRYVQLDDVSLAWAPTSSPPPLLVGARGPKTLRLAGELGDGVILDAVPGGQQLREAREHIEAGRTAAGRIGPFRIVVYLEPPAGLDVAALVRLVRGALEDLGDAGATSVVFVGPPDAPHPAPLLRAIDAARS
ncbi:LLM class flavin-dependent oxidoreductase [Actinomycetospora chiangmaiensis]|uniref:LLM class flavin-dependent oxidoreductase n=1 Tax=Actinomycetospora chiangmaiensis TaxID=402650 RepID=UPI000368B95B|nr:LLM class flavin-dependent oxidoreductase [Actinomycetospora chiangmaiensis]